jgi:hypothetical protein
MAKHRTNQGLPALPLPADAPQLSDVCANLLVFASELLDPAPGAAVLWPGNEVSWDIPDGGLLYCRVISQLPQGDASCPSFTRANLGLGVIRCVATMNNDGGPPPWAERTEDALQCWADSRALLEAIGNLPREFRVQGSQWTALGPEGGVAGGEWNVPVNLAA